MLQSTFELISLAASNSHMIFCLFNLIIAVVVVSSSKSNNQNLKLVSPVAVSSSRSNNQSPKLASSVAVVVNGSGDQNSVSLREKATAALVEAAGAGEDEDKDDEDLKKRVEEFIQKMNEGWRDDKVKTYSLDQSHVFSRF